MDRRKFGTMLLGAAPLVIVGGLVLASAPRGDVKPQAEQSSCEGYICPATGEELPCENCCPLKSEK